MEPIVNKVAQSGLITLDLATFCDTTRIAVLDIKDFLFQGMLLKEKDYRAHLEAYDWQQYHGRILTLYCSTDAILAPWAFMLAAAHAGPHAEDVLFGDRESAVAELYRRAFGQHDWQQYRGKRVLIKGCGEENVPEYAYLAVTNKLRPLVSRLMYGEACSFVPIYRQPKA